MKQFILIYKDGKSHLRIKNPLEHNRGLISLKAYEEFERLYIESALLLLDPIAERDLYLESEVYPVWQFRERPNLVWEDCSEPAFVEDGILYRQVFKIHETKPSDFQENVLAWITHCFGVEYCLNKSERNFRFIEECLELVQSLGMEKNDVLKLVVHTFSRPEGKPEQEVGGVLVTLAALCNASNINMFNAGEIEISNNWNNSEAIKQKHLFKIKKGIAL